MIEIKKKDREERTAKKEQAKKEFVAMLKEFAEDPDNGIDRYTINIKYITPSPSKNCPCFPTALWIYIDDKIGLNSKYFHIINKC